MNEYLRNEKIKIYAIVQVCAMTQNVADARFIPDYIITVTPKIPSTFSFYMLLYVFIDVKNL